jgi:hypothetical protein
MLMSSQKVIRIDDFVKRPRSRRANLVARGVLTVRRSDNEMKRNAEIGLFTKSSMLMHDAAEVILGRNFMKNSVDVPGIDSGILIN